MSREDDYTDEPPRRRRDEDRDRDRDRDRDDDYDRPRRRRDDDDDDYDVRRRPRQLTGLDGLFANTNIVILVLFPLCCIGIAMILGIVGLATCKNEDARQRALIVTIIGGVVFVLEFGARVAILMNQ